MIGWLSKMRLPCALLIAALIPANAIGQYPGDITVSSASSVLDQVMSTPGKQIPRHLLKQARGVAIVPGVVKGGFVVGIRHGRGVVLVKDDAGNWHPPTFVNLTGGSLGWQAGIQSTDVVLVFKTPNSVNNLMNGRLKIGVDAAAAAGPVGREAEAATDARLAAEIYSYSRSRGLFAGVSLEGAALQVDHLASRAYYRSDAAGNPTVLPPSAIELMNRVAQYSGAAAMPTLPTAPPAVGTSATTLDPRSDSESVRARLVVSWTQLSQRLDERWKSFMALPASVISGQQTAGSGELTAVMQRYTTIANAPQYASLAQSPEFVTTYQLLREYVALQSSKGEPLNLPPPPVIDNAGVTRGRY